jgi:hypothetical protein
MTPLVARQHRDCLVAAEDAIGRAEAADPITISGFGDARMLRSQAAVRPNPLMTTTSGPGCRYSTISNTVVLSPGALSDMDQQQKSAPQQPSEPPAVEIHRRPQESPQC